MMDTMLQDGETNIVCGVCIVSYALALAATVTQGMTPEQAEANAEQLDQISRNDPRQPPSRPPAKGGRRHRQAASVDDLPDAVPVTEHSVDLPEPCGTCGSLTATGDAEKLTCDGCGAVLATADDQRG